MGARFTLGVTERFWNSQGLYQWIYRTHEDAQEAREAAGEDPSGEGTREEDQLDSGNGTGRP